jgi:hypothetical protein
MVVYDDEGWQSESLYYELKFIFTLILDTTL